MKLVTIVQNVLATGEISMTVERRMHRLLDAQTLSASELAALEQLIAAIHKGEIRSVPDPAPDRVTRDAD